MTISAPPQQLAAPIMAQALEDLRESLAQALELAVSHHQSGQLEDAENLYRTILEVQPNHPDANHNLGVLAVQMGQAGAGLPYFVAALEEKSDQQHYWLSYIDALLQADEVETAKLMLELGRQHGLQGNDVEVLAWRLDGVVQTSASATVNLENNKAYKVLPSEKPAWQAGLRNQAEKAPGAKKINALIALLGKGRLAEAEVLARSIVTRFPRYGFGWKILGVALQQQGRAGEALAPMQKAVELLPTNARAPTNLGIVLKDQCRYVEAETSLRRALRINPNFADAHSALGDVLNDLGRLSEAEMSCRQALKINPDLAEAHNNLGLILKKKERLSEAEESYRQALKIKPNLVEAHNNLGILLESSGRLSEAEVSYRQALEISPNYAEVYNNLGNTLKDLGRQSEAEASYRHALKIKPNLVTVFSNLLFSLSHNEAVDAETLFAEHCSFGAQFEAPLRAQWQQHSNSREPERCLQVGFVSGDLRNHAVANFIEPVLVHLVTYANLSLHAYANHIKDDSVTQRLRGYVKHWHPVVGLSDAALTEKIRADDIDILIDLSSHTLHNRLLSFARKPAPVQVSWMGYPGTTGLNSMDYYLTDRFLLPPGQFDHQFTEKLVHLPASAPFLPSADAPPVNILPALNNGYLTFGSFNRPNKLSCAVIALWSQLLRALPDARMVLGAMHEDGQHGTLIAWFAEQGIARERLSFHPRSGMKAYLSLHHQVDVCLDTFPYNGGTTTLHALWMGVPTLTLAGSTVAGRTGAGILGHVGLDAFAAQNAAAFVQQGLSLAADFSTLASLRAGLRERLAQAASGQPAVIAAGLERALRTMWQRWCAGLPAESFAGNPSSAQNMHSTMPEVEV